MATDARVGAMIGAEGEKLNRWNHVIGVKYQQPCSGRREAQPLYPFASHVCDFRSTWTEPDDVAANTGPVLT